MHKLGLPLVGFETNTFITLFKCSNVVCYRPLWFQTLTYDDDRSSRLIYQFLLNNELPKMKPKRNRKSSLTKQMCMHISFIELTYHRPNISHDDFGSAAISSVCIYLSVTKVS